MTISGRTQWFAVLGDPIAHSRSPSLLGAAFAATGLDAVMVPCHVRAKDFAAAVAGLPALGCVGASVTMPHKHAALGAATVVEPLAARIGASNCLRFRGDTIEARNTDAPGFVASLAGLPRFAGSVAGVQAIILGAGGAAAAIDVGLRNAGARTTVIARRPERVRWDTNDDAARAIAPWAALAEFMSSADVLIDATPTALDPSAEATLVDGVPLDALPRTAAVCSIVYHRPPLLLRHAAARGLATLDGADMLVQQAAIAFTWWTGRVAPIEAMRAAL